MPRKPDTIRSLYGKIEDRYLDLIRRFPLRPLRSAADRDGAIAVIDELIDRASLTVPEQDYLDVLSDLVETYESETIPMRPVGDAELLRFLIEHQGATQAEAASGSGIAESTISEVLAGKRKLNRGQIAKLSRYFNLEPGVFLAEK
jgi:HTH-type transcriptional regulator/antitoxin HigA